MIKDPSMQTIQQAATDCTPHVDFDFDTQRFTLKGESWPENAAAFYRPLQSALDGWQPRPNEPVVVDIALSYFNSSSTKMLFGLFDQFNQLAQQGNTIQLNWYYDEEDDVSEEFGQELQLDFDALTVQLHTEVPQ